MNWLTRWRLSERFWEPVRRRLHRMAQLRTERDYCKERLEEAERSVHAWREDAKRYCVNADYWRGRTEAAERV